VWVSGYGFRGSEFKDNVKRENLDEARFGV